MSISASYARMSAADVEALKVDPDSFWRLPEVPWDQTVSITADATERLDIGQDWQLLSWLCSPLGRVEERYQAGLIAMDGDFPEGEGAFEAAVAKAVESLGFRYLSPQALPEDPVLKAMQGRREGDDGVTIPDIGLGGSCFAPSEVQALSEVLEALDEEWLRERFDVREIEILGLPADGEDTELDEIFLPQLERLRALYRRAAEAGQHVVVAMS